MDLALSFDDLVALVAPLRQVGQPPAVLSGIASLEDATATDLSFLGNKKYRSQVATCRAGVILVPPDYMGEPQPEQAYLYVKSPSLALGQVCARLEARLFPVAEGGLHPSAVVDRTAQIHPAASVGPLCVVEAGAVIHPGAILEAQCFVGRGAIIGPDCHLMPRVTVSAWCRLGARVRLHSGVVIGADGYGYETVKGVHQKIPQVGTVVIEDDVEIGANSTVDRARFGETRIGQGTKIDNLVQIGHNVKVGRHCLLVAQVGIAGSTTLEDYVVLGGQVGVVGHVRVGRGVQASGQAGITSSIEAGAMVHDCPAYDYRTSMRNTVLYRRLPEFYQRLQAVEKALGAVPPAAAPSAPVSPEPLA